MQIVSRKLQEQMRFFRGGYYFKSLISILSCLLQLNPNVSVFQRKYVNEVKKCEEMERILGELYFHVCPFSPVGLLEWHYCQLQVFLTFSGFVSCEIYLH